MTASRGCTLAQALLLASALCAQGSALEPSIAGIHVVEEALSWTVPPDRTNTSGIGRTVHRHTIEVQLPASTDRRAAIIGFPLAEGGRPDSVLIRLRDASGAELELGPSQWRLVEEGTWVQIAGWLTVDVPADMNARDLSIAIVNAHAGPPHVETIFLNGPYPIRSKRIELVFAPGHFPGFTVHNGMPAAELDPTGASVLGGRTTGPLRRMDTYRWKADDLPPWPASDLALRHTCLPYLRLNYALPPPSTMLFTVQRDFDRSHPHLIVSTGKHAHAFLRFVERIRARHPRGDVQRTVREVVRFVADSVRIVPDSTLIQGEAIGTYFHQRRMSRQKVIALYRSLFTILDIPFMVGHARSRALPSHADTTFAWGEGTHELLGFTAEDGSFHIIVPADEHGAWWMNEAPACIAGTPARFFRFDPALMRPTEELLTTVPATGDHRIAHRASLSCAPDGSVLIDHHTTQLSGLPATVLQGIGPSVRAPERMHRALAALFGLDALLDAERTTHMASYGSRMMLVRHGADTLPMTPGAVRLEQCVRIHLPTDLEDLGSCAWSIPVPITVRADLQLTVADTRAFALVVPADTEHSNALGRFTCTTERTAAGAAVLHLVLQLNSGIFSGAERTLLHELLQPAQERLAQVPFIRRSGPP